MNADQLESLYLQIDADAEAAATPVERAIRGIAASRMTAQVALSIMDALQSAMIRSTANAELEDAMCEMDDVIDVLYRQVRSEQTSRADSLAASTIAHNSY